MQPIILNDGVITADPIVLDDGSLHAGTAVLDIAPDLLIMDGLQTVSYFPPTPPENGRPWTNGSEITVFNARPSKIREMEVEPSAGVYLMANQRIRFPTIGVAFAPKIGAVVQLSSDQSRWVVLQVGNPRFGSSWSLECRELTIDGALHDTITIKRPAFARDSYGSTIITYPTPGSADTNLKARVQSITGQRVDWNQKRGMLRTFYIWVETDVDLPFGTKIIDQDQVEYIVTAWASRKRIDQLSLILAEVRP